MSPNEIWRKVGEFSGLLTDDDITLLGQQHLLISNGFDASQVRQTCYELRVGSVAYFLSRPENERRTAIDEEHPLIVRPQEVVTIITHEEVDLPNFVLGRIISKGHLFSIGLSPVITYADPGFSGNLGITFINMSKKNINFGYKDTICKIEFEKLGKPVHQPYHGPHGFASQIWPIDIGKFAPNRKIQPNDIRNNDLLKADSEYFGEPFDLISAKLIDLGDQIRALKSALKFAFYCGLTALAGFVLFQGFEWIFSVVEVLPETVQSAIVSGSIAGVLGLLAVILEWWLLKKRA